MDYILTLIIALIAATPGLLALYQGRKKTMAEADWVGAGTAEKYQQIANFAAEKALKLDKRIEQLEIQVAAQQKEIIKLQVENELLRDWANRLSGQVQSMGLEPVKVRGGGQ